MASRLLDLIGRCARLPADRFRTENLFVTDASPFPSSAAVNPALTDAALALRAAERMQVELQAA